MLSNGDRARSAGFIDDVLRKTHSGSDVTNIPMMIFINTAVGGVWPGPVGDTTVFPQLAFPVKIYPATPMFS